MKCFARNFTIAASALVVAASAVAAHRELSSSLAVGLVRE
jgi:hypothetical protein